MKKRYSVRFKLLFGAFIVVIFLISFSSQNSPWEKIDDGLFVGNFNVSQKSNSGKSKIIIVRINPKKYELKLFSAGEYKHGNLTVKEWCEKYKLTAAINAGMYLTDYKSNVGYMKNFNYINNSKVNSKYYSVAAFNPKAEGKPKFKIFDIDDIPMKTIQNEYHSLVQNLRLIKRPAQNRWPQQAKQWSEAALGEDTKGNILFIFCRSPYSMHDLNRMLLKLPIDLVCAQHLEGGPEASLYLSHDKKKVETMGSYETGFNEVEENVHFYPLPNVFGIVKK